MWVSVSEKLPEKDKYVLVCFGSGCMAVACLFDTDEDMTFWRAMDDDGWCVDCDNEPVYWMELPNILEDLRNN